MTPYTSLERLAKSAKEVGMAVAADPNEVLRLIEIARAAEKVSNEAGPEISYVYWPDVWKTIVALRAALGTQPVKEMNHG